MQQPKGWKPAEAPGGHAVGSWRGGAAGSARLAGADEAYSLLHSHGWGAGRLAALGGLQWRRCARRQVQGQAVLRARRRAGERSGRAGRRQRRAAEAGHLQRCHRALLPSLLWQDRPGRSCGMEARLALDAGPADLSTGVHVRTWASSPRSRPLHVAFDAAKLAPLNERDLSRATRELLASNVAMAMPTEKATPVPRPGPCS